MSYYNKKKSLFSRIFKNKSDIGYEVGEQSYFNSLLKERKDKQNSNIKITIHSDIPYWIYPSIRIIEPKWIIVPVTYILY